MNLHRINHSTPAPTWLRTYIPVKQCNPLVYSYSLLFSTRSALQFSNYVSVFSETDKVSAPKLVRDYKSLTKEKAYELISYF